MILIDVAHIVNLIYYEKDISIACRCYMLFHDSICSKVDLGSLLGKLSSASKGFYRNCRIDIIRRVLAGVLGSLLSNVLSNDKITTDDMVGIWQYSSPAVAFKSDDLLKKPEELRPRLP